MGLSMNFNLKTLGLVGLASLLCVSLFANWWLRREASLLQEDLYISQSNEVILQSTLSAIKAQSEAADAATTKYADTIEKLRKERDKLRRETQAARKTDAEYRSWADTRLPPFVVDKYNGLYETTHPTDNRRDD